MSKNNFWAFLKWYFKYTNKEFFDNSNSNTPSYVGNKERLPFIIISYLYLHLLFCLFILMVFTGFPFLDL